MRRQIRAKVDDALAPQPFDGRPHRGEILQPDRHASSLENAVELLPLLLQPELRLLLLGNVLRNAD